MTFEDHEFVTMQHRDHALIQQLEKDCTKLRQRVDVLETGLKWIRDNPKTDADALRDIAVTILLSGLPLCGNCGHPRHVKNSEVCLICRDESINGNRPIEDCCAAYVLSRDSSI